jgi:hypothetical protein
MSNQNQTSGSGQGQPASGQTGNSHGTPQASQGLMGIAKVSPSGVEYKSYDPVNVKHGETRYDR